MIRATLTALLTLVACSVFAQANTPPTIKVTLPKEAKPGAKVQGTVEVTFADGLHGYQNPPTDQYQIPVKLTLDAKGYALGKIEYPKGAMMTTGGDTKPSALYAGKIKIPFTVTVPKTGGSATLKFVVSYQQCNDQSCYPPANVSSTAKLLVKK